jgi:iron complex transport system substrate-binding protein
VKKVEGRFADVRREHPEFSGVRFAYAGVYGPDKPSYYVETNGSTHMRVLQDLGFVCPMRSRHSGRTRSTTTSAPNRSASSTRTSRCGSRPSSNSCPEVKKNPLYVKLDVAKEGRDIFLTDPNVAAAMAHSSVLSLPVVPDLLEPELTRAVGNLKT